MIDPVTAKANRAHSRPNAIEFTCQVKYPTHTFTMADSSNHAIVFGASGLIGWAIVDQLLRGYPRHGSFSTITAVTNRPLDTSESLWPTDSDQPDLQLVSGVDLRKGDGATLADSLKQAVEDVESVTHIYYLGTSLTPPTSLRYRKTYHE